MDPIIELEGWNGKWFTIHGEGSGAEGVYLGTNVGDDLLEAPVKTIQNSTARQTGSSPGGDRHLQRDIVFGVVVTAQNGELVELDSEWRKAWSFRKHSKLWVTIDGSRRWLNVALAEQPKWKMDQYSPLREQVAEVTMTVIAHDPWWYEEPVLSEWKSTTDTTGGSTQLGTVTVSNPTDNDIWLEWVIKAPGRWTLPDYSFNNPDDENYPLAGSHTTRRILMPSLGSGEHVTVRTNPESRLEKVASSTNTQVWARMNGVEFMYPVPAYTKPTTLPVSVTGAPVGIGVQVRQPRPWSRPWGLQ